MTDRALARAVAKKLGREVTSTRALHGGDIHAAFRAELAGGGAVFIKTSSGAPAAMFPTEARGLDWLRAAKALRIPEVLAFSDPADDGPPFLVLEYVDPGARNSDFDQKLGQGLAQLHRFGAPSFGLDHDNFIGSLEQSNVVHSTWATFYRDERLAPLLRRATDRGRLPNHLRPDFDRLFERLPALLGPAEPPSRLHGDLWGGNLHVDERGQPCLLDPAVYGGHREVDLAMMRLFGGFGPRVFAAYQDAWPLADGHERRVPLYQLYPLLVHVNLFGGGYVGSLARALGEALAR